MRRGEGTRERGEGLGEGRKEGNVGSWRGTGGGRRPKKRRKTSLMMLDIERFNKIHFPCFVPYFFKLAHTGWKLLRRAFQPQWNKK